MTTDRVWLAFYGGKCGNCGYNFNKGTPVRWDASGGTGLQVVEDVCSARDVEELGLGASELKVYREQMCMSCFTVHGAGQEGCQ